MLQAFLQQHTSFMEQIKKPGLFGAGFFGLFK
jgi:hypothetical protein